MRDVVLCIQIKNLATQRRRRSLRLAGCTNNIVFRENFKEPGVTAEKAAPSLLSSVTESD